MKAVVMAAGEGYRMRPLTYTRPKVMLPIANKPILEHLLIEIKQAGISDFVFIVGYCDEQVRAYFGSGDRWGVKIVYRKQAKQLGTADAVKAVEGLVDGNFLVLNGDNIIDAGNIKKLVARRRNTMAVIEVEDTTGLGTVEQNKGRVVRIHEKTKSPPSRTANAGVYLFTPEIFGAIAATPKSPRGEYEITESLRILMDSGHELYSCQIDSWLDLTYPWHLLGANETLLENIEPENLGKIEKNVTIKGKVRIGKNTTLKSGAYIVGPAIIGEGCDIGPNCHIRGSTSIGDGCHIGAGVEVKNSIVMRGSKIPHLNYVGDSIIGEDCNFGAGTKIANLRLDEKDIAVGNVNTRRRKLGAIIGDGVKTGINASINVGTTLGNDTFIGPGTVVSGVILPNSKVL